MLVFQTLHPELSGVTFFTWPADSDDGFIFIFQSSVKLAAAELNQKNKIHFKKCHDTRTVIQMVQLSHRRSPPHTTTSRPSERPRMIYGTWKDEALLGCRFPLIHLIRQRIYKAYYVNAIFCLPKTITPFMNTAAHYQHIRTPVMCRVAPRKSIKRQYFIL